MDRNNKLIAITKAIQEAVLSLNRVISFNPKLGIPDHIYPDPTMSIGIREILLCLNTKSKDEDDYIIMSTDGWFSIVKSDNENDNMLSVAQYNLLKDSLEDQDDELINFLFTFTQS